MVQVGRGTQTHSDGVEVIGPHLVDLDVDVVLEEELADVLDAVAEQGPVRVRRPVEVNLDVDVCLRAVSSRTTRAWIGRTSRATSVIYQKPHRQQSS